MSDLLQAGHHPDADQLNAFVEHALPAHEQQQTLAHLAVCPACRQIVALSLPPADESPAPHREPIRKHWFFRWHLAWAGVPAVAALVLFIIFIRNSATTARQTSTPAQMAAARPPASAVTPVTPPAAATSGIPKERQAEPVVNDRNARHAHQEGARASMNQPSQPQSEALQQPARGTAAGAIGGVLGGISSQSLQLKAGNKAGNAAMVPAPTSQAVPAPPATTVNNAAAASVGGPVEKLPQPTPVPNAFTTDGLADRAQNVLFTQSAVPSHLAVLSMAANAHQRLAIDTQNHLFFSNDDGRHWKTVPSQWKGRAVRVALASPVSNGNDAPTLRVSSHPTTAAGSALSGTITDASGAIIPGATVVATNSNATLVRSLQTDSRGQFRIDNIPPGSYRVEAQSLGFLKQSFTIDVAASQQTVADVTLQVGAASQTVEVQASPSPIATEPAAQSVDAKKISEPASQAPPHFEITTETGARWTSADGQTWKPE